MISNNNNKKGDDNHILNNNIIIVNIIIIIIIIVTTTILTISIIQAYTFLWYASYALNTKIGAHLAQVATAFLCRNKQMKITELIKIFL